MFRSLQPRAFVLDRSDINRVGFSVVSDRRLQAHVGLHGLQRRSSPPLRGCDRPDREVSHGLVAAPFAFLPRGGLNNVRPSLDFETVSRAARRLLSPRVLDGRSVFLASEVDTFIANLVPGRAPWRGQKANA